MSGKRSQRKGKVGEQEAVRILNDMGVPARRTASLQAGLGRRGDVPDVQFGPALSMTMECKRVARQATLYRWVGSQDALWIRADDEEPLIVLPLRTARLILPAYCDAVIGENNPPTT